MPTIDIRHAKIQLEKLVDAVSNGQEFILADEGKPVARLIPVEADRIIRRPGAMRGKIKISDDFDAPVSFNDFMRVEIKPSNS